MQIKKVAVITAQGLFLLLAFSCFLFIWIIYLKKVPANRPKVSVILDGLGLAIFTAWLFHLAIFSLVYTIRYVVGGQNKIEESNHQQQQKQEEPQNLRSRNDEVDKVTVVGMTKLLCAVTCLYVVVFVLVKAINQVVNILHQGHKDGKVGSDEVIRVVFMLTFTLFILLLVLPVSCIKYATKVSRGGNNSTSPSSMKELEIHQQQRSDGKP